MLKEARWIRSQPSYHSGAFLRFTGILIFVGGLEAILPLCYMYGRGRPFANIARRTKVSGGA